jgi:hypothetical protein
MLKKRAPRIVKLNIIYCNEQRKTFHYFSLREEKADY